MSAISNELEPQPDPIPATGDVWHEIIGCLSYDDPIKPYCIERRQQGIERYGVPLQRGNGRDHLLDALQEALDLMAYAQAAGLPDIVAVADMCGRAIVEASHFTAGQPRQLMLDIKVRR